MYFKLEGVIEGGRTREIESGENTCQDTKEMKAERPSDRRTQMKRMTWKERKKDKPKDKQR